jgi:hypothetical protein
MQSWGSTVRTVVAVLGAAGATMGLSACGSGGAARTVTAGEFAAGSSGATTATTTPTPAPTTPEDKPEPVRAATTAIAPAATGAVAGGPGVGGGPRQVSPIGSEAWPEQKPLEDLVDVSSFVGRPEAPNPSTPAVDVPITVDSVVGQINGRPVFASEILNPLHGRLVALGTQVKEPTRWRREAARVIVDELGNRIEDELILSEARANLTPEIRQGLFRFLDDIQKNLVSQQQGSAVKADEELRATTGRGLFDEAQDRLDREIIANELRTKILPRVNVSWRSVQQEYERREGEFNPPPVARFRLIAVSEGDAAAAQSVAEQLSGGKAFEEVAKSPANTFNRPEGGLVETKVEKPFREAEFFTIEELNAAARGLSVGQTGGPIAYATPSGRKMTGWIHLEAIDTPASVSLYDAQLKLQNELRDRRFMQERRRYFDRLKERGNVSKIEDMAQRLMLIAIERYQPKPTGTPGVRPTRGDDPTK